MFEVFEEMKDIPKAMSRDSKLVSAEVYPRVAILYFKDENNKEYFVKVGEKGCE